MTYHASSYITLHTAPENAVWFKMLGILAFISDAQIRKPQHVKSVKGCFNCMILDPHQSLYKVQSYRKSVKHIHCIKEINME